MTSVDAHKTKFHALLHDQIRNEFNASHQYTATAVYFDNADLPQLAKHFYKQAVEERNHAMMIIQYFLDRGINVELSGVDAAKGNFENAREPIALALTQEKTVTEQIVQLASTAREEGDYLGEQFMQWFLKEQVEEVASMTTLLAIADRAGANLFHLEDFVAREISVVDDTAGAPAAAGGAI
ncbi:MULTISPECIES: ferritin [Rhodococcus]|jgi:ferritin|uniref:Ferritin n=1 Tax=Rhodococcus oxybenzonivorans TaxID=1990687 RepID=A0AAE5A6H8_9NOCA|nr:MULTISPECIES: ferritin [Rhodococcus]MDV7243042.1 ferritin [Rhodococcus oxybenzonivorans]MDV7264414.1 ferritin [Rhodococcus oxybenzonivorans]MDV7275446.1 ferritin [Rhodococcus oxybenzonivorans]MDV7334699.1 ferritin [Rhodococcus oxybenzonivorans]MDV7344853.1 ferritin [Rhodococcus oxybenzonivorans]